ncbi:MAG: type II toxin-antitoxin system VapC family toxin [Thiomargarita sp.]|nr:type II toxin-antitoxin system VapC family toxin [Thiomargarita sp.]
MNNDYYLLDTCTVSDFVRGHPNVLERINNISPHFLVVSSITIMEIEYGLKLNPGRVQQLETIINDFLESIHILAFEPEDARIAADLRVTLRRQGTPIGSYDVLLAGCALQRGFIFVTSNLKEFQRVPRLKLENWRDEIL